MNSTPFFINQDGGAFLRQNGKVLSWGDFAALSGLAKVTSMLFRTHMSNVLVNSECVALMEVEQFALCHSQQTQQKYYANPVALKAKTMKAQSWYDQLYGQHEVSTTMEQDTETREDKRTPPEAS